jgi:hypothetical protein
MIVKGQRQNNPTLHHCIAGFISTIWLFVASRTADLPIVGLQDDVGTIDILSKV